MDLSITVTSDFICPWCFVGERRLARAIADLPEGINVRLNWKPFELNPDMDSAGMDRRLYRTLKFGSWERSQLMDAHTVEASKGEGIAFNYEAMEKTPNTFLAHRLMKLAEREGKATKMANALFSAYFEQGRDIGDASVLTDLAVEVGVQREQAQTYLRGDAGSEEVRADERLAQAKGVRSVPFFDISGDGVISGAQSPEQFKAAVLRAAEAMDGCANGACALA